MTVGSASNGVNSTLPLFLARALGDPHVASDSFRCLQAREHVRREFRGEFKADASHQHHQLNRYNDILCYDKSRLQLPKGDYVNASWVREPTSLLQGHVSRRRWVAAQAPLPETLYDFWSLFLVLPPQDAPRKIIMLTALEEGGRPKCERYFPSQCSDHPFHLEARRDSDPPIHVGLVSTTCPHKIFRHNRLAVNFEGQDPVEIDHFECLVWQDHGVPDRPEDLLDLIRAARGGQEDPPTLVHCSAGVGRTGTYIATSIMLDSLSAIRRQHQLTGGGTLQLNVPEYQQPGLPPLRSQDLHDPIVLTVDHLRAQRCLMVQTKGIFDHLLNLALD